MDLGWLSLSLVDLILPKFDHRFRENIDRLMC